MEQRRIFTNAEFRTVGDGKATRLCGYASVFDSDSEDMGFIERVAPGAFTDVLSTSPDVRCLLNHDPSLLLGRTTSGTLRLRQDSRGLWYEVQVPDTTVGRDLLVSASRGDISQSSYGFRVSDDEDSEEWYDERGNRVAPYRGVRRVIRKIGALFDVSPVTYPAFTASTVEARSGEHERERAKAYLRSLRGASNVDVNEAREFLRAHRY
jgi:HK97 family phage prohead protease